MKIIYDSLLWNCRKYISETKIRQLFQNRVFAFYMLSDILNTKGKALLQEDTSITIYVEKETIIVEFTSVRSKKYFDLEVK